ncbi:MAG: hypothetical protein RL431_164 [Actinomycetota bacterium]
MFIEISDKGPRKLYTDFAVFSPLSLLPLSGLFLEYIPNGSERTWLLRHVSIMHLNTY